MPTPDPDSTKDEIQRLLREADDETKKVIELVTKFERGKLYQRSSNRSATAREVATIIRDVVR